MRGHRAPASSAHGPMGDMGRACGCGAQRGWGHPPSDVTGAPEVCPAGPAPHGGGTRTLPWTGLRCTHARSVAETFRVTAAHVWVPRRRNTQGNPQGPLTVQSAGPRPFASAPDETGGCSLEGLQHPSPSGSFCAASARAPLAACPGQGGRRVSCSPGARGGAAAGSRMRRWTVQSCCQGSDHT